MSVRGLAPIVIVGVAATTVACVSQTDNGGDWIEAATIDGELATDWGPAPTQRFSDGCRVRIASWNVHFGEAPEDLANNLLASTETASADVLLIQEVETHTVEDASRTRRLAEQLGMTWVYAPARTQDTGTHGIAILSRHPLEDVQVRRLPRFEQPIRARDRNALAAEVVFGSHRLRLVNLHLDLRLGPVDRIRQLHPAVNDIPDRVLVGGDFNTNPWAWFDGLVPLTGTEAVVGQEQASVVDDYLLGKQFESALTIDESTMRLPGFAMRIDNFYSRELAVLATGIAKVDGSDHWPIWIDLDLCR